MLLKKLIVNNKHSLNFKRYNTSLSTSVSKNEEIEILQKLLAEAKKRLETVDSNDAAAASVDSSLVDGEKFVIGTYNAVSKEGLDRFPKNKYEISKLENADDSLTPHAILLRSYKLKNEEVPASIRAINRCGAGVNNIPVDQMTERGIPVFNTPGANANAVKELAVCALLLASRGIIEGIEHTKNVIYTEDGSDPDKVKKRVESDKKNFVGHELMGKTLGVIGLGHIGSSIAESGLNLGMNVIGHDPGLSLDTAWRLPGHQMTKVDALEELLENSDYISLNAPYSKATHHLIGENELKLLKPGCHIVNFARAELVDGQSMRTLYDKGERFGRYICDFPDEFLHDHPKVTIIPHLGASTEEAESNSAVMAANQIMNFIETGTVLNAVNFPNTFLPRQNNAGIRLCIVNKNLPGMLGLITSCIGSSNLNIVQQINSSKDDIAYSILDLSETPSPEEIEALQQSISLLDGVISSRVIAPQTMEPGFFHVN